MNQPHVHNGRPKHVVSSENDRPIPSHHSANLTASNGNRITSGEVNDGQIIREIVGDAMRNCARSRIEIAEIMTRLSGTSVSEAQLNKYAAESRSDYRFPAELQRAFCMATGDNRLLTYAAESVGLYLVGDEAKALMDLGREYLRQKRAAAAVASLEARLEGVAL